LEALNRLMVGRTTFMIAHRLSTLDNCDLRLELSAGKLRVLQLAPVMRPGKHEEDVGSGLV
jgi:ATP-binding cassette subfamily B protein